MMQKKELSIQNFFNEALENYKKNNFQTAADLYKKILEIDSNHVESIYLLGTLFSQNKNYIKAKELLEKAIKIKPDHVAAHNNLGSVMQQLGEFEKAKEFFEKTIKMQPNYVAGHSNLGIVYKELGDYKKAINSYQKAIQIKPNYAAAHINLGIVFKEMGDFEKAIICFNKTIQIKPNFVKAHKNLMEAYEKTNQEDKLNKTILNAKKLIINNPIIKLYEGIIFFRAEKYKKAKMLFESISFENIDIKNEITRISNLAKCCDQIGESDEAFKYFSMTNNLIPKMKRQDYSDKKRYLKEISTRSDFFKKTNLKQWSISKSVDQRKDPVFLVGFPRSGTTLLDTILRSHPMVEVIEEKFMVKEMIESLSILTKGKYENLEKISSNDIIKIRKDYFNSLDSYVKYNDSAKIYIDKLPLNIIYIGEIIRVFPNSRFILSMRHPCDCVLSCFIQNFKLNDAMANFLNLNDAAHLYDSVMNLWIQYKSIFSINYYEVKYENLVSNFKPTIQSVLKFLNLPWNDQVLEYSKTAKKRENIATPSYNQVIKPIYSHASGRWQRYKKHTSSIYPTLEPWIKRFKY